MKQNMLNYPVSATHWLVMVFAFTFLFSGIVEAKRFTYTSSVHRTILDEAVKNGTVPPALALAVARVESNFSANAESTAGARGVMQIMPSTAWDEFGVMRGKLWDERTNVRLGVAYLERLYRQYGKRWDLALSHYNGGSLKKKKGQFVVHQYTFNYVKKVMKHWRKYQQDATLAAFVVAMKPDEVGRSRFTSNNSSGSSVRSRQFAARDDYWTMDNPRTERDWRHYLDTAKRWLGKPTGENKLQKNYNVTDDWTTAQVAPNVRNSGMVRFRSDDRPVYGHPRPYRFQ